MTVYVDEQFLLNGIVDYLLLLLAGRLVGRQLRRGRLAVGALLGSLYAVACLYPWGSWLSVWPIKLLAGMGMVWVAYGGDRRILRILAVFYGLACGLGGGIWALSLMQTGTSLGWNGQILPLDWRMVLLWSGISWCLLQIAFRGMGKHSRLAGERKEVTLVLGGRRTVLTALVDSGNTLTDPTSGGRVLVAEWQELLPLCPALTEEDVSRPAEGLLRLGEEGQWRLLPYRAVGTAGGLLLALTVDEMKVEGRRRRERVVALSPTPVSDGGGYSGLLSEE
jgi:stage II sporulation protein GA (sporulation sigma-E factor processing peptidase)